MSGAAASQWEQDDRLLTFEVSEAVYALPISEVLEVVEVGRICCVPTLPIGCGGVMNWHGDALPVVWPDLLLDRGECRSREDAVDEGVAESDQQVLVLSDRSDDRARMALPIDRVLGLVDGSAWLRHGAELVVERRSVDGRVVSVLDPRRLVARAVEVIEQEAG